MTSDILAATNNVVGNYLVKTQIQSDYHYEYIDNNVDPQTEFYSAELLSPPRGSLPNPV